MSGLTCVGLAVQVPDRVLFDRISFDVGRGEAVALVGPSGSGKTTLLNAIAGVVPSRADVLEVAGRDLSSLDGPARSNFRLEHIGIVFQFGELLPEFTVAENVALPLRFQGRSRSSALGAARSWLDRVGLAGADQAWPETLSGGERQRAAVARALAGGPTLVLADEPTGSLDRANAGRIARLLVEQTRAANMATLIATHDLRVAGECDRVLELEAGILAPAQP